MLTTIISIATPSLALIGILLANPGEGTFLEGKYFAWFLVGSALLVASALLLLRRSPRTWKNGSLLIWLAAACFMGAYTCIPLDDGRLERLRRAATLIVAGKGDQATLATWQNEAGPERTADASTLERIEGDKGAATALAYILAVAFVATFYMIGVYASPARQREYGVLREELEDPLAFKAVYGLE